MKLFSTVLALLALSVGAIAQTYPTATGLPAPFGLTSGACVASPALVLSIPVSSVAPGANKVTITFTCAPAHTWYGDIEGILTNPLGGSSEFMIEGCQAAPDDSSDVAGPYTIDDSAAMTFDAAAIAAGLVIPAGTYAGDNLLNPLVSSCDPNGVWTVTFNDWFSGDTGSVSALSLTFSVVGVPLESYTMCQAGPGRPLTVLHLGGTPGGFYCNPVTATAPGNYPGGYFFGMNYPFASLVDQLTNPGLAGITWGFLDATGSAVFSVIVPPALSIDHLGAHFNAVGGVTYSSPPSTYVTI